MLAFSARPILLYDAVASNSSTRSLKKCLTDAMFSTLPGLDANDPPKTISTIEFYYCILSSVCLSIICFFGWEYILESVNSLGDEIMVLTKVPLVRSGI